MTEDDLRQGPAYYVVGTRPDGSQVVLACADTPREADSLRNLLAPCESYTSLAVEKVRAVLRKAGERG